MWPLVIVALQVGRQGGPDLGLGRIGPRTGSFERKRLIHALDLAVLPRAVGPGVDASHAGRLGLVRELSGAVRRTVVGCELAHLDVDP